MMQLSIYKCYYFEIVIISRDIRLDRLIRFFSQQTCFTIQSDIIKSELKTRKYQITNIPSHPQNQMHTLSSSQKRVKMKVTVIGNQKSGKSSFIRNLVKHQFTPQYQETENFEITLLHINNNNTEYEIQLWECGARHFNNNKYLRKAFFRNSSATLLIFDLCSPNWRETVPRWIQEAYNCESFLIYAIGTKKDLYEKKTLKEKLNLLQKSMSEKSLFKQTFQNQVTQGYEYENNLFFEEYQIRHFYQSATEKIPYEIKNIFVTINDDKQKLTRSSLARGTKFDNSLLEGYASRFKDKENSKNSHQQSVVHGSVRQELCDDIS